jgi:hypothetical protein
MALADEQREQAKRTARPHNDPARVRAEEKCKKLRLQYNKMWENQYREISERLKSAVISSHGLESIEDLKRKLDSLKAQSAKQVELFEKLKVERRVERTKN